MKKIITFWISVCVILLGIYSCNDSSNPALSINNDFVYPLEIGNRWSYNASMRYSNVSPDSLKDQLSDYAMDISVSVTRKIFIDTIEVYEMKEESEKYTGAYAYYSNKEEGFLKYAYSNSPDVILPKTNGRKTYSFKGISFNNISEFIINLEKINSLSKTLNDSIIYFAQPRVIYSYPLEVGSEWDFSISNIKIVKEVIEKETINSSFGNYSCFKIQWKYDFDNDGIVDDDFIYYEYLCSKGIMKRTLTLKNVAISTVQNPGGISFADVKIEQTLTGINF